ncbi:MAG TPA: mechanosensitive ion channel domain-containing protein, partial [Gemmatimonadota bacterium]|nr:mechanosensitive ion channel domain-containing protein [Gemmatimonadota bacterium]
QAADGVNPAPALQRALEALTPGKVVAVLLVLLGAWIAGRVVAWALTALAERTPRLRIRVKQAIPIVQILLWGGALYVSLFGIFRPGQAGSVIGLVAGAAVGVGLAVQDLLRDLAGGVALVLDRPFQVGDRVRVGDHYGEILSIGIRSIRLRTPEDTQVTLPNSYVMRTPVSNASSGSLTCQVVSDLWLPADAPVAEARRVAFEAAASSRYVDLSRPVEVAVESEFRETFLVRLRVKAYVLDHRDEVRFRSDVVERAQEELVRRGIVDRELVVRRY